MAFTWRRDGVRASGAVRPGRPARRQCSPTDIMRGRSRALGVERVEGVAQVGEELVAGIELLGGGTLRGPSSGLG